MRPITSPTLEPHYSVQALAELLGLSDTTTRRLFEHEPGVLRIGEPSRRLGRTLKRRYFTLRIPESAVRRVQQRLASKQEPNR
jgi:hypothetical protein